MTSIILAGPVHATSAILPVKTKVIHCPKTGFIKACENEWRCCRFLKTNINISIPQSTATPEVPSAVPLYNFDRNGLTDLDIETGPFIFIE